jgi:hypothetical protein
MPLDKIVRDGDLAIFDVFFGAAIVIWRPVKMIGTGHGTVKGKTICVEGDAKESIKVPGCMYIAPGFPIPGVGDIMLKSLLPNHKGMKTKTKGKKVLLKGADFICEFKVNSKAMLITPTGAEQDPMSTYIGKGRFITLNFTHQAT